MASIYSLNKLLSLTLISVLITLVYLSNSTVVYATSYYVDGASLGGTCNDSNAGTSLGSAWCSLTKAATTATASDTIFVREATYRETVTPTNSGISGSPLTFQKYASETPVVAGSDLITGWASLGSSEPNGLFVSGFETNNFTDFTSSTVDSGVTLTTQSSTVSSGTYAATATFDGAGRNARLNKNITGTNDVYARMYFRLNSSYTLQQKDTNQVILYLRADSSINRFRISLRQNNSNQFYLFAETMAPSQTTIYNGSSNAGEILPDTWYYLEARYKGGDGSTGGAELWLNGTSKGSNYSMNTTGLQVGRIEFGPSTSGTAVPTNGSALHMDAFKANTSAVGAFAPLGAPQVYQATGINWTLRQLFQDGTNLGSQQASSSAVDAAGEWYYDSGPQTVYVWPSDSGNPNSKTMEGSRRTTVFDLSNKSYITLDGLTVKHNNSNGSTGAGVLGLNSSNLIVQNMSITDNYGVGVYLKNTSQSSVLSSSILRNMRQFGGGIRFENGSSNNLIASNTITGTGQTGGSGMFLCGDSGTCNNQGNNSNTIRGNTISNVQDSCMYLDTNNDSNTIENNTCYDSYKDFNDSSKGGNGIHLSLGSDNNIIRNNLVYNVERHGISSRDNNTGNLIYNNTTYNTGTTSGNGIDIQGNNTNTVVKNNISHTAATAPFNVDSGASDTIADYNLWYNPSGTVVKWSGSLYTSFSTYQTAINQDLHSLSSNPLFVDPTGLNFRLQSSSPAKDAGVTLSSVTTDSFGTSRPQQCSYDIGFHELSGSCITPTPTVAPTTTVTNSPTTASTQPLISSTATPQPPQCSNAAPQSAPDLFQIDRTGDSVILYFSPANNPVSHYYIAYGPSANMIQHGIQIEGSSSGVHKVKITHLDKKASYTFLVRAGNGCATGNWSNTLQVGPATRQYTKRYFKSFPARIIFWLQSLRSQR